MTPRERAESEPLSEKIATIESLRPSTSSLRPRTIADYVFGRRLATNEEDEQKIGPVTGVAVLGLDALSSAAYGPEAALTLLIPLGFAGLREIVPISLVIVALLLIVYFSYRQTIAAYPNGGGSYTVAKENLGQGAALLAGAALALDYILNVAVGISAGVGALVSAAPSLLPHTVALCLVILFFLTLVNLRGTKESGLTFLLPTYLFVATLALVVVVGAFKTIAASGHPAAVTLPPPLALPTETLSVWLVVRAFAGGCTAMTGVEAVSNGVPIFRAPTIANAQRTLTAIIVILVGLLAGIAVLCHVYRVGATEGGAAGYQSVLSQLSGAVLGRGIFYYVTMGAVVAVLCLSANTSFADFPRLCRVLALDRFLPDTFATRGRRLVFSYGVVVLSVVAGVLLVGFSGVTDRLIPLFAVGAFLAFTLSQSGMVAHWQKVGGSGKRQSQWINAIGALATGITLVVVIVSKFLEGAWVVVVVVPLVVLLFSRINRHYRYVGNQVADAAPLDVADAQAPIVVVPVQSWNKLTSRGLRFAIGMSSDVRALHILADDASCSLTGVWEKLVVGPALAAGVKAPHLILRRSSYRQFFSPLVGYVEQLRDEHPDREIIVIVPDLVVKHWYHALLHNNRGMILKGLLRLRGGPRVVVVNTPFYLSE